MPEKVLIGHSMPLFVKTKTSSVNNQAGRDMSHSFSCFSFWKNVRFWMKNMNNAPNQVTMALFGAILGQNQSHGV